MWNCCSSIYPPTDGFCHVTLICIVFMSHPVHVSLGVSWNIRENCMWNLKTHVSMAFSSPWCCFSNSSTFSRPEVQLLSPLPSETAALCLNCTSLFCWVEYGTLLKLPSYSDISTSSLIWVTWAPVSEHCHSIILTSFFYCFWQKIWSDTNLILHCGQCWRSLLGTLKC